MIKFDIPANLADRYDICIKRVPIGNWVELEILAVRDPDILIDELDPEQYDEDERLPYWAEIWPAAIGLGRHLFEYPLPVGSKLLELGCGLGVAGIAAAAAGQEVVACDYEKDAIAFSRYNARLNGQEKSISFRFLDWRSPNLNQKFHIVIGSDIIYETPNHYPIQKLLDQTLKTGGMFHTSDPGRRAAESFVKSMINHGYRHSKQSRKIKYEKNESKIIVHRFIKTE